MIITNEEKLALINHYASEIKLSTENLEKFIVYRYSDYDRDRELDNIDSCVIRIKSILHSIKNQC